MPRRNPVRLSPDSQTKEFQSNYYSLSSSSWTNTDELTGWSPKKSKQMNASVHVCFFCICSNFLFFHSNAAGGERPAWIIFQLRTVKLHRLDGELIVPILFAFDIPRKKIRSFKGWPSLSPSFFCGRRIWNNSNKQMEGGGERKRPQFQKQEQFIRNNKRLPGI